MAVKRDYKKQNTSLQPVPVNEMGKLPPQAIDFEEVVLGALMIEPDAYSLVGDILMEASFYKEAHQKIYSAIASLFTKGQPIDLLTVTEELRKKGVLEEVGGPVFITGLTTSVASAAHIEYHARIIQQKYLQRELIRASSEIQRDAYNDEMDVKELLDKAESSIFKISENNLNNESTNINPIIKAALMKLEEASKRTDSMSGHPSGFSGLDKITSGWQPSDLIIIAARPAMGKTAFVLSMARNMAVDFNIPVAIFSLEMANLQLVNRLIVTETEIPAEKIKTGRLEDYEWEQLNHKIKNLEDAPIYLDDTAGLSVFELRSKCRRLKDKYGLQMIIIDYLQLMTAQGMNPGSREQEVSMISRNLKALAKELNVPVIALSQLNRGVESRSGYEGKRPQLSDLRESGAIEQDADMVLMIHRPEYYGMTEDPEGNSLIGMAELIIAKHRNGSTGTVSLRFKKELARFMDPEVTTSYMSSFASELNALDSANGRNSRSSGMPSFDDDPLGAAPTGDF